VVGNADPADAAADDHRPGPVTHGLGR
jgi:hypothetical protein